jgi:hypothetical protein
LVLYGKVSSQDKHISEEAAVCKYSGSLSRGIPVDQIAEKHVKRIGFRVFTTLIIFLVEN